MRFLIDSMLPPRVAELLETAGHDAMTPARLGAHNLPDDMIIEIAAVEDRVIVTENARDFVGAADCAFMLVRKAWWPAASLAERLAAAIDHWATDNREPGLWAHWLAAPYR